MKRLLVLATIVATSWLGPAAATGPAEAKVSGPNGQILFGRFDPNIGDTLLFTVNPDGSHVRQVLPFAVECAHWSPNGSLIATCGRPDGSSALIINPDTRSYREVFSADPTLFLACSVWSPDAKRLACGQFDTPADPSRVGIYTIRVSDGGGIRRVTSNPGGGDDPIDYSPNGKQIVFGRTDPNGPPGKNQALFVVNLGTGAVQRITPWGWSDDDGSWSPDGTKILFEHLGSLYTVHPDGSGLSKISLHLGSSSTAFSAFDGGWSPDGTKLVLGLRVQGPTGSQIEGIATANADGSAVQMITTYPDGNPTGDSKADWGPHPLAT